MGHVRIEIVVGRTKYDIEQGFPDMEVQTLCGERLPDDVITALRTLREASEKIEAALEAL